MVERIIKFNDDMVKKYRLYASSVNKDNDNLGFVEYLLNFHLDEYISDVQHNLRLLQKLQEERKGASICSR